MADKEYPFFEIEPNGDTYAVVSDEYWLSIKDIQNIHERYWALSSVLIEYLAKREDNPLDTVDAEEFLAERCEVLGISPDPCPMCGRYSEHSHEM